MDIDTNGLLDVAGQLTGAAAQLDLPVLPTPDWGPAAPGLTSLCDELAVLASRMASARHEDVSALVGALRRTALQWEAAEADLAAVLR